MRSPGRLWNSFRSLSTYLLKLLLIREYGPQTLATRRSKGPPRRRTATPLAQRGTPATVHPEKRTVSTRPKEDPASQNSALS
jgi:hypothetical protein